LIIDRQRANEGHWPDGHRGGAGNIAANLENAMKKIITMVGIAGLLAASLAAAHPNHDAEPMTMKQVTLAATTTASGASIQVTEAGKAISTAGATGTLTLSGSSGRQVVQLKPAGGNILEAKSASKIAPGTKGQASIVFGDQSTAIVEVTLN
jgi:hypothetical protein